ncbi:MAG: 3-oxoacyl-[acyl-carrier protein] reductase [Desertimonas sp.]|nr:3-oxoacyl-[acyl-carrier protein] reductase [Desertimonas sp.]
MTRIAVVTGASGGLGRDIAVALAARGHPVALVARSADPLAVAEQEIRAGGGEAVAIPTDVSVPAAVEAMRSRVVDELGPPSILVNAAGVFGPVQLIKDSDPTEWVATMMIDAVAPYLVTRAFVGGMVEAGWGRIVNLTSAASLHPPGPMNSAYGTAKAALNQFTRHLAAELAGTGVTANVLHPGDVKTDMWADIRDRVRAAGPLAEAYEQWVRWVDETGGDPPSKAVDAVLALCDDAAAHISGQFRWIDDPLQPPIPSWDVVADERPWTNDDASS